MFVRPAQALLNHSFHVGSAPNALYGDANYVAMYLEPPVALAAGLVLTAFHTAHEAGWLNRDHVGQTVGLELQRQSGQGAGRIVTDRVVHHRTLKNCWLCV